MGQIYLNKGPLLNDSGNLNQSGYAFELAKDYSRKAIKASPWRIKEWDYYYVGDENYGIALTIADNSYMDLLSVSVLDFKNKKEWTKSYMEFLTFGMIKFPETSLSGDVFHESKKFSMYFKNDNGRRRLVCSMKNVAKGKDFSCDIILTKTSEKSMVIATPFRKKKHFYYNQKINNLKAKGSFTFGDMTYRFDKTAMGVLDWGRGVWTYSNTWYWSSLNAVQDGKFIGFNLGYGFGDTSNASENMLFVDNKAYKLNDVKFNIPLNSKGKEEYLKTWTILSESKDINLTFTPILDRYNNTNVIILQTLQHQVFGYFNGEITVNNEVFKINNLLGFAEKVKNRY